ncbi:MAG TPA: gamma-glutamyltransferase family protein [Gemmatimonadaceae bacterium]|nr:gamma-glutamyltransferase family protein [Gemmatimonadaceae bacterium]
MPKKTLSQGRRPVIYITIALAAASCAHGVGREQAASPASRIPATWRYQTTPALASAAHAMIASNSALASAAGVEILEAGGNAVDAAVATGFALAVTLPEAGNIGGGGYMVIRMADGRTAALDYREIAPLAATRNMYIGADGKLTDESVTGYRASGVPGAVAGMAEALKTYGTMPLRRVMEPAIRLATVGFPVDSALARSIASESKRLSRFAGADRFLPGGSPPAVGSTLVQPELARTLNLIADQGPDAFYQGTIAKQIVDEMQRGHGLITEQDLASYRPRWRDPIHGTYRGYSLLTMPPSSSGGVTMIETLNVLETHTSLPPYGSAAYARVLGNAFKKAFTDRNNKLGDPEFVQNPVDQLTSKSYARAHETTHYSVVDANGNAVATTTTLNALYGSGVYVRDAGFFLNDEMDDFAAQPRQPNMFGLVQGEQNAIAPGKRMLSAMSPTIVTDPTGKLFLVVGARGGPRIISSTMQVIVNAIDYHMSLADAIRAPRVHHQALPDTLRVDNGGFAPSMLDSVRAMGMPVAQGGASGTCTAVMRGPDGWVGAVDPRATGGAVGY